MFLRAENNAQPLTFPIQDTCIIDTASLGAFSFQSSHYEISLRAGVHSPVPVHSSLTGLLFIQGSAHYNTSSPGIVLTGH